MSVFTAKMTRYGPLNEETLSSKYTAYGATSRFQGTAPLSSDNLADTPPSSKKSEPELASVVDVEPELNHVGAPAPSAVLSAHNINYTVKIPTKCCGPKVDKQILYDVTGVFKEGLSAIMGPTGCGKSTLLDILACRKDPVGVSGQLLLDGKPVPDNFKCMVGYVVQDDIVMGTLTVRENFHFSASLRLPTTVSSAERSERVDNVIKELGLTKCADTKVGNEFIRGVSGGERKRCNIGMELIISPPVLFLDEPTTGLDASTANTVILFLKGLSKKGRTVIFSIHQPRYSIYRLFDHLVLLAGGYTVYNGPAPEALDFFATQGFMCQEHNNPPDFFLDIINGDPGVLAEGDVAAKEDGQEEGNTVSQQDMLITGFRDSHWNKRVLEEAGVIFAQFEAQGGKTGEQHDAVDYPTSFGHQVKVLAGRTLKDIGRHPQSTLFTGYDGVLGNACAAYLADIAITTLVPALDMGDVINARQDAYHKEDYNNKQDPASLVVYSAVLPGAAGMNTKLVAQDIGTAVVFSAIVDAIFWQLEDDPITGFKDRCGVIFFLIIVQLFFNLTALEVFIKERKIFMHENVSGFYRVSVYFLVKIIFDILPLRTLPIILMSAAIYFAVGLNPGMDHFFMFMFSLICTTLAAAGMSFMISSTVHVFAVAQLLLTIIYTFMMLFGGFLISLDSIGPWLNWIQHINLFKYALTALYINEFKDRNFCMYNGTLCKSGNSFLMENEMNYKEPWDLWLNHTALLINAVVMLIGTYVQLRRMKKTT